MEASALPPPPGLAARSPRLLRLASDERLVGLVRDGQQPAFEAVFDRYHRGILSFCRHMLSSREEAEDAVQHTFMAAYRSLIESDRPIQLRPWLYAIARNRCLSVLRGRREQASLEDVEPATEGLASEVQQREDLQQLLRDLAGLPEDQRAALVLAELGDVPHEEIAHVLECPREKVKALVFQARTSLSESRKARDTSCQEIREQLATLTGGALRRNTLRRHLRECDGCREFRAEVQRQRRAMAIVLPVVPSLGLKEAVLAGTTAGGAAVAGGAAAGAGAATAGAGATAAGGAVAAGAGAGGGLAGLLGSGLAAKVLVGAVIAGGGTVGGVAAVTAIDDDSPTPTHEAAPGGSSEDGAGGPGPGNAAAPGAAGPDGERGNSDRAHDLARSRGRGRKRGLNGTQPGQAERAAKRARRQARRDAKRARQQARHPASPGRSTIAPGKRRGTGKPARPERPRPTPSKPTKPPERTERTPKQDTTTGAPPTTTGLLEPEKDRGKDRQAPGLDLLEDRGKP